MSSKDQADMLARASDECVLQQIVTLREYLANHPGWPKGPATVALWVHEAERRGLDLP